MPSKKTLLLEFLFQLQMQIYQHEKHGKFNKAKTCQKLYLETFGSTVSVIQKLQKQPSVEKNNKILTSLNFTDSLSRKHSSNEQNLKLEFLNILIQPLWEARFFSTVYGLRPGRSGYDLIINLQKFLQKKSNYFFQFDATPNFEDNAEKCANYLLGPNPIPKKAFLKFKIFNTIYFKRVLKCYFSKKQLHKIVERKKVSSFKTNSNLLVLNFFSLQIPSNLNSFEIVNNFKKIETKATLYNIIFHKIDGIIYKFKCLFLHFFKLKYNKITNLKIIRYTNQFLFLTGDLPLLKELVTTIVKSCTNDFIIKMHQIGNTLFSYEEKIYRLNFLNFEIHQIKNNREKNNGLSTLISPSRTSLQNHLADLKQISQQFASQSQENLIFALTTKIRAWCNYYQICSNKKVFFYLDYLLFKILWRWACRRHSKKSRRWIKDKYFHSLDEQNWLFSFYQKEQKQFICLPFHAEINLIHYTEVDNEKSPYDSDFTYWLNRYR